MSVELTADGSAPSDAVESVTVDLRDEGDRWRYVCPNGHRSWEPTNNHLWCGSCRRQLEHDDSSIEAAEHYELVDKRTGRTIPWSAVTIIDPDTGVRIK